jgi:hemin uptake protein HemP
LTPDVQCVRWSLSITQTDTDPRPAEIDDVVSLVAPTHIVESLDLLGGEGDVVDFDVG